MRIRGACAALLAAASLACIPSACSRTAPGAVKAVEAAATGASAAALPLLPLDADEYLVAVAEADILPDYLNERLVATKRKSVPDSPVVVSVEGLDAKKRKAVKLWEAATAATAFRGFTVSLMDLVGDHSMEIVCRGLNGAGRSTLDVFRKSYAPKNKGPAYTSACRVAAEDIRIEKVDRPEGYQTGQKNGPSYPVVAYAADAESRNPMDLVRTVYAWKYTEARYVAGIPERMPAEKVEQRQLEELFAGSSADGFETFLEGSWKKPSQRTTGRSDAAADPAILFQPHNRTIAFYTVDTVEVYEWLESRRTVYNGLQVTAESRSYEAASVRKSIFVYVRSPSSIDVFIQGGDSFDVSDGTYARTVEWTEDGATGAADGKRATTVEKDGFSGTFLGEKLKIVFSGDRAEIHEGKNVQTALCTVFRLSGGRILSLRVLSQNGLSKDQRDYLVEERDRGGAGRGGRSLVLVPVTLTARGFEETAGEILSEDLSTAGGK